MFIDEAVIKVVGGRGGNGKVAYFANKKGVSGGDGGNGGAVYATSSSNIKDLKPFTEVISYHGHNGEPGGSNKRHGHSGADLTLKMPIGTSIIDLKTSEEVVLSENSGQILLCKGGRGGQGNASLKKPTYPTPKHALPGENGQERSFTLILKLIADFGFIGLPNAGKSSLLNTLTATQVKIADYPFTTLEPNLGVFEGKILADVPGLIEGASSGKGLGIKFLKHIEKVHTIFHCISLENKSFEKEYKTVLKELSQYNKKLLSKKIVILLTKKDLVSQYEIESAKSIMSTYSEKVIPISINDSQSIDELRNYLRFL